jgi:hypothetical protein
MAQYAFTFTSGDTVTPTKLNDARTVSEIVDADIKSDAAIAGTKIAPDFGSQNVVTTGTLTAGPASAPLTLTNVGQLLVGHSGFASPRDNPLSVAWGAGASIGCQRYTNNTFGADLRLFKSRSDTIGTNAAVLSGDTIGQIAFYGADGTDFIMGARIFAQVDGAPGTNDMPVRLVFSTTADGASSPTERMRIKADGEVQIAGTTDRGNFNLQCNGTGVWGAGAYTNGSDERLKENIAEITEGLEVVNKLRPVSFNYKPEHSKDTSKQAGFIAQELLVALEGQDYLEGTVSQGPDYYNVAYQNLIPVLAKAIQELSAKVTALETAQ